MMATVFNQVGPYEILHEIGRGGMAVVFLARDTRTDSPVALKLVAQGVNELVGPGLGVLLITHYQRMLNYITPDRVHVMMRGRIVKSGGAELATELEEKGYEGLRAELGLEAEAAVEVG